MKKDDVKNKQSDELARDLEDSRKELRGLRFDLAFGKIKNVRQIRFLKKKIARILTAMRG